MTALPRIPPLIGLAAFGFPAACLATGCDCETLCAILRPAGCIAIAAISAAALFVPLALLEEARMLSSLHPHSRDRHPKGQ